MFTHNLVNMHSPNTKVSIKLNKNLLADVQKKTASSGQNIGWLVEGKSNVVGWYTESDQSVGWYTEPTN